MSTQRTQVVEHQAQSERGTRVGVAMVQRWARKRKVGAMIDKDGWVIYARVVLIPY